jgi:hypothetical protein
MAKKNYNDYEEDKLTFPNVTVYNGSLIVPVGYEKYYASIWRWKLNMGISIESPKFVYLKEYENEHGVITHRERLNRTLAPMPTPLRSNNRKLLEA